MAIILSAFEFMPFQTVSDSVRSKVEERPPNLLALVLRVFKPHALASLRLYGTVWQF